ncbi:MAG TPA: hypothetical protein VGB70_15235 [Allosphingosinicella sp.]|jgi:hypothetical protein
MAVVQLNLSRRALLGAAFAAPVLSVVEGPVLSLSRAASRGVVEGSVLAAFPAASASGKGQGTALPAPQSSNAVTLWDRALSRFQVADAQLAALAGTQDEDRYDRAGTRHVSALVRLLRTPAPHAAALADKLDLLIAHQAWEYRAGDACLAALSADARRLAELDAA